MSLTAFITGATSGIGKATAEDIEDVLHFVVTRLYHVNTEYLIVCPTVQTTATIVNKNKND